ncbi:uncharacterized protein M421DRAFT_107076 [Didymella exigua CBS 183.55]|uniref:Uncharacterized protein n=1 Tax=Didymella exigua CBS 183.55 TaxID=1150837 RepID=A0A6A5S358_9PLEO|nr:uncharacterized protein M421DRAFT_107076 [Didymella exigua CBS 183.55]KAF1933874.1 hypothetical protein M421DRAFT_107076 [Didymella exigua CBS 183.55]
MYVGRVKPRIRVRRAFPRAVVCLAAQIQAVIPTPYGARCLLPEHRQRVPPLSHFGRATTALLVLWPIDLSIDWTRICRAWKTQIELNCAWKKPVMKAVMQSYNPSCVGHSIMIATIPVSNQGLISRCMLSPSINSTTI